MYVCVYVAVGRFCMCACVYVCAYVSGVDCMVHRLMSSFVGKKKLVDWGGGVGGCTAANEGREWYWTT